MEPFTDFEGDHARQALEHLLVRGGLQIPSSRAIAAAANVSPATLTKWFGGRGQLARRAAYPAAYRFTYELRSQMVSGSWRRRGFVPGVDADGDTARLRLRMAWAELARHDAGVAQVFDQLLADEWAILRAAFGDGLSDLTVTAIHAYLIGIWDAVARREQSTSHEPWLTLWTRTYDDFRSRYPPPDLAS
ncbi:MAG: hypothetical protein QM572_14730 [Nocardioides sp.]|uniref:TetR/AcrR family transcriptional regulator n=1 Tax=Nocardioides sp. TaxID=35761 RepID=UPI0039E36869